MKVKDKKIKVDGEQSLDVQEATALDTLKPGNNRASKSELLSQMMKVIGGMTKEDLSAFLTKTLDQVGKEADSMPDNSAKNKASVETHGGTGAMKEDLGELLSDNELTEEFKTQASTLFEAAVQNRVVLEVARLEEEYETKLNEQVTQAIDELHEQVDKYTDYVAKEWLKENEVTIKAGFRVESTESFIEGLKNLFTEHYVEMPEERLDVVGELTAKIDAMQEELDKVKSENIDLVAEAEKVTLGQTFVEVSEGLTDTQVEKFRSLCESIEFKDVNEYKEKLGIIKDQYFKEDVDPKKKSTGLINEENIDDDETVKTVVPPEMKSYVSAISRNIKK